MFWLSKLREGADLGDIDDKECTHSPIMQAIDLAMMCKASRPGIVDELLQNAFWGYIPFEVVSLTGLGTGDAEKERVLKAIKKASDDMWLREPEYDSSGEESYSRHNEVNENIRQRK